MNFLKHIDWAYALTIINVVVMVALVMFVTLQNRSSGLSNVFGGAGVVTSRRGVEKWLFYATIVAGTLFCGLSIGLLFLQK